MATDYGCQFRRGRVLQPAARSQQPVQWTFSTPGPSVVASFPKDQVTTRTPVVFVAFDQRIVPDRVLATIRLRAGVSDARLRLATSEEIDSEEQVRSLASAAEADRWLAFRPLDALPPDAAVVGVHWTGDAIGGRTEGRYPPGVVGVSHIRPPARLQAGVWMGEASVRRGRPGPSCSRILFRPDCSGKNWFGLTRLCKV